MFFYLFLQWDYFEVPELETFLKLLEKEEAQYVTQIKRKFDAYKFYLMLELQERGVAINYDGKSFKNSCLTDEVPRFIKRDLVDSSVTFIN